MHPRFTKSIKMQNFVPIFMHCVIIALSFLSICLSIVSWCSRVSLMFENTHSMMLCIQRQREGIINRHTQVLCRCSLVLACFWPHAQTEIIIWKAIMMIIYMFRSVFTACGRLMNIPGWVNTEFKDFLASISLWERERWGHQNILIVFYTRYF